MARGVDLAEPVDGHQRVDLGGGHRGVAEQFLDDADVAPRRAGASRRSAAGCAGTPLTAEPVHPPARSAAARRIDQALCRDSGPPRALRNSGPRGRRRGSSRPGPAGRRRGSPRPRAARSCRPGRSAPCRPCRPAARPPGRGRRRPPPAPPPRRCARRCRRGARAAPGRGAPRPLHRAGRLDQRDHRLHRHRLGQPPRRRRGAHLRGDVTGDQAVEQREPVQPADGDHRPRGRGRRQRGWSSSPERRAARNPATSDSATSPRVRTPAAAR